MSFPLNCFCPTRSILTMLLGFRGHSCSWVILWYQSTWLGLFSALRHYRSFVLLNLSVLELVAGWRETG